MTTPGIADPGRAGERLLELINAQWTTAAIHAGCVLGVPETLARGPVSADTLAAGIDADPSALRRLLRALASLELVIEADDGEFSLTPMGALLQDEAPGSLRPWALLAGGLHWARWGELAQSVRTGHSHRRRLGSDDGFEYLDDDPAIASRFHRSMASMTRLASAPLLAHLDVGAASTLLDVGGGNGELLAALLARHPQPRGVLFDQPHALALAPGLLRHHGVEQRCECIAGSFFDSVPPGADVILMKSILHDWDDPRCGRILANCRAAMSASSRLLVIERVLPERRGTTAADRAASRSDLNMLVSLSGRERTLGEFGAMFDAAGLRLVRHVATGAAFDVIEGRIAVPLPVSD